MRGSFQPVVRLDFFRSPRAAFVAPLVGFLLTVGCARERPPEVPTLEPQEAAGERSSQESSTGSAMERPERSEHELAYRYDHALALASQRGFATYYGNAFAGRLTASGEPYDPRAFTAAHRSLPFGTIVRVERLDGNGRVYVRITDRGPFGRRSGIVDLSRAAAENLGMVGKGVLEVRLEVVHYGPKRKRRRR